MSRMSDRRGQRPVKTLASSAIITIYEHSKALHIYFYRDPKSISQEKKATVTFLVFHCPVFPKSCL